MGHSQELYQDQNGIQSEQQGQEGTKRRHKLQEKEGKRVRGMGH